jgi:hypothetical protein
VRIFETVPLKSPEQSWAHSVRSKWVMRESIGFSCFALEWRTLLMAWRTFDLASAALSRKGTSSSDEGAGTRHRVVSGAATRRAATLETRMSRTAPSAISDISGKPPTPTSASHADPRAPRIDTKDHTEQLCFLPKSPVDRGIPPSAVAQTMRGLENPLPRSDCRGPTAQNTEMKKQ